MTDIRYPFPKAELHLHLDGSIPPETMWELAKKEHAELPTATLEEFRTWLKVTSDCSSVNEYLERFELPLQLLQKKENLSLVTESLIDVLAGQGYGLAEIRFAPQLHLRSGLTQRDAVEAVLAGQEAGLKKHPSLKTGILLCAMSIGPETLNMAENLETVRLTKEFLGKGVVGCDLAGAEGIVPLRSFHPVFDLARELNVPFTCHAGDSQGSDTIKDALDFGTKRIGHGHHLYDAPELWQRVRDSGATLEEAEAWVLVNRNKVHHQFFSSNMTQFHRTGRVSGAAAAVAWLRAKQEMNRSRARNAQPWSTSPK